MGQRSQAARLRRRLYFSCTFQTRRLCHFLEKKQVIHLPSSLLIFSTRRFRLTLKKDIIYNTLATLHDPSDQYLTHNVALVCGLESTDGHHSLLVSNTHLFWNPEFPGIVLFFFWLFSWIGFNAIFLVFFLRN